MVVQISLLAPGRVVQKCVTHLHIACRGLALSHSFLATSTLVETNTPQTPWLDLVLAITTDANSIVACSTA